MAGIIVVLLLLAQIGPSTPLISRLERLQAKVRVDSVQNFTTAYLAGKYSYPAKNSNLACRAMIFTCSPTELTFTTNGLMSSQW